MFRHQAQVSQKARNAPTIVSSEWVTTETKHQRPSATSPGRLLSAGTRLCLGKMYRTSSPRESCIDYYG